MKAFQRVVWLLAVVLGFSAQVYAQTDFVYQFPTSSGAVTMGSSANLTAGSFSNGNPYGGVVTGGTFSKTLPSNGYQGASAGYNIINSAQPGALDTGSSAYFAVTLTPASGRAVQLTGLSFGEYSSGSGALTFSLRSSLDNYRSEIAGTTIASVSTWALQSLSFPKYTGTVGNEVTFRLYAYGGNSNASPMDPNTRLDDIKLTADGITDVPEPTPALAGLLLGLATLWHQCRRRLRAIPPQTGA